MVLILNTVVFVRALSDYPRAGCVKPREVVLAQLVYRDARNKQYARATFINEAPTGRGNN